MPRDFEARGLAFAAWVCGRRTRHFPAHRNPNGRVCDRSALGDIACAIFLALCANIDGLVLAADARRYIAGLTAFREERVAEWCSIFAEAIQAAAATAAELAESLAQLQQSWRSRAGMPRRHSSAEALIKLLPAYPIVTLATATQLLGRSKQAANEAIAALARAAILSPTTLARRNRAWEARELFELVNATERELATANAGAASPRPAPGSARRKPPSNGP